MLANWKVEIVSISLYIDLVTLNFTYRFGVEDLESKIQQQPILGKWIKIPSILFFSLSIDSNTSINTKNIKNICIIVFT